LIDEDLAQAQGRNAAAEKRRPKCGRKSAEMRPKIGRNAAGNRPKTGGRKSAAEKLISRVHVTNSEYLIN